MVVANILLALGMMMLSPTTISLPFKLLLFVRIDGWATLVHGLVLIYCTSGGRNGRTHRTDQAGPLTDPDPVRAAGGYGGAARHAGCVPSTVTPPARQTLHPTKH